MQDSWLYRFKQKWIVGEDRWNPSEAHHYRIFLSLIFIAFLGYIGVMATMFLTR